MEKQTDKELEDEINRKEKQMLDLGGRRYYVMTDKVNILKAELKGRKEARQGMIKIEDVNKMIDDFDFIKYLKEQKFYGFNETKMLKKLKQSLQKLGEK